MIRVKCPQCAKVLGLKDDVAGKMAKCPACNATFKVPSTAKPAPKKADIPDPLANEETPATTPQGDDINPYGFAVDEGPKDKEAIRDDRVDEMVRTAQRDKKRNQAWEQIGTPAKLLKIVTLIQVIILLATFVFFLLGIILFIHQQDQWEAAGKPAKDLPRYIWPVSEFASRRIHPGNVFLLTCAVFIPSILICGVVMAGAEAMKKMEGYGLAMTGAIIGCLTFLPVGLLGVMTLMRKPIKYEFGITELRKKGDYTEPVEEEEEDLVEEEEEEEDEDEEEEEEEEKTTPAKKSKRKV